jgi:signal transduction histidine kinase
LGTISSNRQKLRLLPSSSQFRNALAYMLITSLVLVFLNIYSATTTRNLMFQAKNASAQDKIQLVVSSFSGVDALTQDSVSQVISVLGDINVSRIIITDGEARALYDSSVSQNSTGRLVLFEEVVQALSGNDVFHCDYHAGALESYAAMPIMSYNEPIGCVYIMEYDAGQGKVIANLEKNILRSSLILEGAIVAFSIFFSIVGSGRMRKILTSMRLVREGQYSHKIQMRGGDELTTLATEFNKLTDRLQASEDAQRQFVSDASHELKTPLASIKLLSDSILQNQMDTDTMREFVADIGSEADRLTRMTQKLLTLSRSENAEEADHEVVDVGEVVSRVFRMLVPLADNREIRLTGELQPDCTVLCYEDDIYQILFNLIENGIKYNQENGSVHVTVGHSQEDVTVAVTDTGVGIPSEALDHIFERFYRVDKARSRQAGGSGLGLSIVRELAARNYGTISVKSELGRGTCFTATFPYFELDREAKDEEPV